MISNKKPKDTFYWAICKVAETEQLKNWTLSNFSVKTNSDLTVYKRTINEGLATGFSRHITTQDQKVGPTLSMFANTMRRIATGANEFFFFTRDDVNRIGIPEGYFIPAIGRTRDAPEDVITPQTMEANDKNNRPTLLLSLHGKPINHYPLIVQEYIRKGEELKLHERALIKQRKPWYKMEYREVPPILFTYLGRRNTRFIRNLAGVVPPSERARIF